MFRLEKNISQYLKCCLWKERGIKPLSQSLFVYVETLNFQHEHKLAEPVLPFNTLKNLEVVRQELFVDFLYMSGVEDA